MDRFELLPGPLGDLVTRAIEAAKAENVFARIMAQGCVALEVRRREPKAHPEFARLVDSG